MAGGRTDGLIKNFRASGAIAARRIVAFAGGDALVVQAGAATDMSIGISVDIATADGERVDVAMGDIQEVDFGGPVTRGQPLTSDAQGRAVAAAPAAGANVHIVGFAMVSGVLGDIGSARIAPCVMQG